MTLKYDSHFLWKTGIIAMAPIICSIVALFLYDFLAMKCNSSTSTRLLISQQNYAIAGVIPLATKNNTSTFVVELPSARYGWIFEMPIRPRNSTSIKTSQNGYPEWRFDDVSVDISIALAVNPDNPVFSCSGVIRAYNSDGVRSAPYLQDEFIPGHVFPVRYYCRDKVIDFKSHEKLIVSVTFHHQNMDNKNNSNFDLLIGFSDSM